MASEAKAIDGFDYAVLSDDVAAHARAAAHRIRRHEQKATEAIFEIGKDLIALKQMLDHGQFIAWVQSECLSAVRTAQNYMKAAQTFDGKYATVAHLAPTTVYALASAPPGARAEIVSKLEAGERPSEVEIKDHIWLARQQAKAAKLDAKLSPRRRRSKKRAEDERLRDLARFDAQRRERAEALKAAGSIIREALGSRVDEVCSLLKSAGDVALIAHLRVGHVVEAA